MQKTPDRVRGYSSFSARWRVSESKLRSVLPPATFLNLTALVGWREQWKNRNQPGQN